MAKHVHLYVVDSYGAVEVHCSLLSLGTNYTYTVVYHQDHLIQNKAEESDLIE